MRPISEIAKQFLQESILPGAFQWRLADGAHSALTFDDGPDLEYTPRVLDLLAEYGLKATFFVVGTRIEKFPDVLRRVAAEGHSIGSHTQTHRELPSLSRAELSWELATCRQRIADTAGIDTRLVRPPRGRISLLALHRVKALGYKLVHWSRTYSDYRRDGREALLGRMRPQPPQPRDIILLHDNNPYTIEALHDMLPRWLATSVSFTRL
jgi:peptidoglycan/xylan/chitin deacetylase (PgdA/CDA1 family)